MNKNTVFTIICAFFGVFLFLGLFEIGLRIAFYHSMNFDVEMWKYARELKRVSQDYETAHEHEPNQSAFLMGTNVTINSKGLRNPEVGYERTPGTKRVLMLGDSLTFGWGVDEADTPSRLLERNLNAAGNGKFEVINTGVGNYNSSMQVAYYLNEGYKYNPDLVILNYFINDAEPTPRRKSHPMLGWSYVYVYLLGRLDVLSREELGSANWKDYYSGLYQEDQPGWKVTQERISALASELKKNGIPLLIVNYPELHELKEYPFSDVTAKIQRIAEGAEVSFLDLTPSVLGKDERSLWVSDTDAHPNAIANEAFSAAISEHVQNMLSIK